MSGPNRDALLYTSLVDDPERFAAFLGQNVDVLEALGEALSDEGEGSLLTKLLFRVDEGTRAKAIAKTGTASFFTQLLVNLDKSTREQVLSEFQ